MSHLRLGSKYLLLLLVVLNFTGRSQLAVSLSLKLSPEVCEKGNATLIIDGRQDKDSVVINWSTGETNVIIATNQSGGEHNVRVYIKRVIDKKIYTKDTLLIYNLPKEECEIRVSRFFSPNDDGTNDLLIISNINNYPNFDLEIYNKWGQRVHRQSGTYTPWDGKWLGADLPDGTYYFVLFYDAANKSKLVKGDITILR